MFYLCAFIYSLVGSTRTFTRLAVARLAVEIRFTTRTTVSITVISSLFLW